MMYDASFVVRRDIYISFGWGSVRASPGITSVTRQFVMMMMIIFFFLGGGGGGVLSFLSQ